MSEQQKPPLGYHNPTYESSPHISELFRISEEPQRENYRDQETRGVDSNRYFKDQQRWEDAILSLMAEGMSIQEVSDLIDSTKTIVDEAQEENVKIEEMYAPHRQEYLEQLRGRNQLAKYQEMRQQLSDKQHLIIAREQARRAADGLPPLSESSSRESDRELSKVIATAMNKGELPKVIEQSGRRDGRNYLAILHGEVPATYKDYKGDEQPMFAGFEKLRSIILAPGYSESQSAQNESAESRVATVMFPVSIYDKKDVDLVEASLPVLKEAMESVDK